MVGVDLYTRPHLHPHGSLRPRAYAVHEEKLACRRTTRVSNKRRASAPYKARGIENGRRLWKVLGQRASKEVGACPNGRADGRFSNGQARQVHKPSAALFSLSNFARSSSPSHLSPLSPHAQKWPLKALASRLRSASCSTLSSVSTCTCTSRSKATRN